VGRPGDENVSGVVATTAPVPLHTLPIWIDITAMSINAAFGAAVARNRRLTLLAVLIAGVIVGLGGGMVRDVLLGLEAAAIEDWYYLPAVLGAALVGGFLAHRLIQGHTTYLVVHGVAVALLVTIGVQKALEYHTPGDTAIFLGVLTGTMGGVGADVMAGERASIFRKAHLGLASVVLGAVIFWLVTTYVNFWVATVVTIVTAVPLDLLSVKFGWASPMFPGDRDPP
jgi:uncharacterized membrane protein YeiH